MKSYAEIVEKARKTKSSRILANSAPNHANILIKNLFISAREDEEKVRIVSGKFAQNVYDESVAVEVTKALGAKIEFDVILTDVEAGEMAGNPVYEAMKNNTNATITFAKDTFGKASHFVLVGNSKYRLEANPEKISAIASFNDPSTGALIGSLFKSAHEILAG